MIFSRELLPGDRVPEEKIAETIGGSRTPVREAIRLLSSDGLVQIEPRRCARVTLLDENGIEEIGTVRLMQDLLAARLAIQYGTYQDFLDLMPIVEKCEKSAHEKDPNVFIHCDDAFHLGIARISRNKILIENQRKLYLQVQLIQTTKYAEDGPDYGLAHGHIAILEGLLAHNYPATCNAICDHLKDFYHLNPSVVESLKRQTSRKGEKA
jgi:DNA-binding GntR family transcriptional regulator